MIKNTRYVICIYSRWLMFKSFLFKFFKAFWPIYRTFTVKLPQYISFETIYLSVVVCAMVEIACVFYFFCQWQTDGAIAYGTIHGAKWSRASIVKQLTSYSYNFIKSLIILFKLNSLMKLKSNMKKKFIDK